MYLFLFFFYFLLGNMLKYKLLANDLIKNKLQKVHYMYLDIQVTSLYPYLLSKLKQTIRNKQRSKVR